MAQESKICAISLPALPISDFFFLTKKTSPAVKELNWEILIKMFPGIPKLVEVGLYLSALLRTKTRGQWVEEDLFSHCSLNQLVTALKKSQWGFIYAHAEKAVTIKSALLFQQALQPWN